VLYMLMCYRANVTTGALVAKGSAHIYAVKVVAFHPIDSRIILTGSADITVKIWNMSMLPEDSKAPTSSSSSSSSSSHKSSKKVSGSRSTSSSSSNKASSTFAVVDTACVSSNSSLPRLVSVSAAL
jgi:WD40 repeat protein